MTEPVLPQSGAAILGRAALGEPPGTSPKPTATVVAITRAGPLVELRGARYVVEDAPPLRTGQRLSLDLGPDDGDGRPARVLEVAGRQLNPAAAVRLLPAASALSTETAAVVRTAGQIPVELRSLGPDGRPVGPPLTAKLSVPAAPGPPPPSGSAPPHTPPSPQGAGANVAQTLPATLETQTGTANPGGRAVLATEFGRFEIAPDLDLPDGTRLGLTLPPGFQPRGTDAVRDPLAADPVRTLVALLTGQAQGDGGPAALKLPQPSPTLAANLLRWVHAIQARAGHEQSPPSEPGHAPATGPTNAANAALAELGRQASEPLPGQWRALTLPLGFEGSPELRLYLRDDRPDGGADRDGDQTRRDDQRAVFALELSELGRCQLDVLCAPRRFDLIIRTESMLPGEARHELGVIFQAAKDVGGLAGNLGFRGALLPLPAPPNHRAGMALSV